MSESATKMMKVVLSKNKRNLLEMLNKLKTAREWDELELQPKQISNLLHGFLLIQYTILASPDRPGEKTAERVMPR